MTRALVGLTAIALAVGAVTLAACGGDHDPDDRRLARQDEYALGNQQCGVEDGRAVASGDLTNHSGRDTGFGVIVRFFDGDVDLGRPQTTEHPEPVADGDTYAWEVGLDVDATPTELRCNVIQVVIGDAVSG